MNKEELECVDIGPKNRSISKNSSGHLYLCELKKGDCTYHRLLHQDNHLMYLVDGESFHICYLPNENANNSLDISCEHCLRYELVRVS